MISSELEEIVEGADRVFVLRDGKTVAELDRGEISEPVLMNAMAHGEGRMSVEPRSACLRRHRGRAC